MACAQSKFAWAIFFCYKVSGVVWYHRRLANVWYRLVCYEPLDLYESMKKNQENFRDLCKQMQNKQNTCIFTICDLYSWLTFKDTSK